MCDCQDVPRHMEMLRSSRALSAARTLLSTRFSRLEGYRCRQKLNIRVVEHQFNWPWLQCSGFQFEAFLQPAEPTRAEQRVYSQEFAEIEGWQQFYGPSLTNFNEVILNY